MLCSEIHSNKTGKVVRNTQILTVKKLQCIASFNLDFLELFSTPSQSVKCIHDAPLWNTLKQNSKNESTCLYIQYKEVVMLLLCSANISRTVFQYHTLTQKLHPQKTTIVQSFDLASRFFFQVSNFNTLFLCLNTLYHISTIFADFSSVALNARCYSEQISRKGSRPHSK